MKIFLFLTIGFVLTLSSCSNIPNKPVSEKLSVDELAKVIKSDTSFNSFYEHLRREVDEMDDIKKATFNEVNYRRLFKYVKFLKDTIYWKPLNEKWEKEWKKEYGIYSKKADSTIDYWKTFLAQNSLDKYVKVELAKIDKYYYTYIGDLKEVYLGFKLTPLQGPIEQIRFNYSYKAKIYGDAYSESHNCILTTPFSSPTIKYWEVDYSERDDFANISIGTFLRDYDVQIEITKIRKDGVNISTDDFKVPEEITDYFAHGENDELMRDYYKEKIIKELVNKDYLEKWEYRMKKANEIKEKEDKLCFDFLNEL